MSILSAAGYGLIGSGLYSLFTAKDPPAILWALVNLACGAGLVAAA